MCLIGIVRKLSSVWPFSSDSKKQISKADEKIKTLVRERAFYIGTYGD